MKITLASLAAVLGLAGTAMAQADYRYKLKPGWTQPRVERYIATQVLHTAGFSDIDCWMGDGNAKIGWKHISCVGMYTSSTASNTGSGRFKLVYTLLSCSRERRSFEVAGEGAPVVEKYKVNPREWRTVTCAVRP